MAAHSSGHSHSLSSADVLREHGRRLTPQRAVIWEVITADPDVHLTAEQIAERTRARMPQLNASTVYRNLDVLVEDGLVLRTDLGESKAFFEPARDHPHHHLVCERCGGVEHAHDDVLAGAAEAVRDAHGFVLGTREVTLHGLCAACAARRPA